MVIFFSNILSLMPLKNILQPDPNKVEFQIRSVSMLCTVVFLIFGGLKCVGFSRKLIATGITAKNIVGMMFYLVTITACLLFLRLAQRWPKLLRYWTRVEMIFLLPPYEKTSWSLRRKLLLMACCFGVVAVVEHSMYYASCYYNYIQKILLCQTDHTNANFRDFLIQDHFKDVFSIFPFSIFSAFGGFVRLSVNNLCQACPERREKECKFGSHTLKNIWQEVCYFINFTFTFIWNYMDLFVMMVGVSLAARFQQFAARMKTMEGLLVPDTLWYALRQHHIQLCELMEHVDEHLSSIIMIAAMNNMYFICNQLLNIFTKLRWPINYVYFWFSLMFLITRTAGAFLCASAIHDASVVPLKVLYLVPAGYWTEEVQRFAAQLTNQCIALTGKRFYSITRKNLFGFFATIATYELVLLQLDRNSQNAGLPNLCA